MSRSLFKNPTYEPNEYLDHFNILIRRNNQQGAGFWSNKTKTALSDGGDSTFHTGNYWTAFHLMKSLGLDNAYILDIDEEKVFDLFRYRGKLGVYCRHPYATFWGSDSYRFSRDQQKSVIAAESFNRRSWKRVIPFMLRHGLLRLFLFDAKLKDNGNYDWKFPTLTGPTIWASYIRYFINMYGSVFYLLYPLLLVFDIQLVLNLWVKTSDLFDQQDDTDVLNHINYSCWFHYVAPTPWTWLNLRLINVSNFTMRLYKYYDDGCLPWFVAVMWADILSYYKRKVCRGACDV